MQHRIMFVFALLAACGPTSRGDDDQTGDDDVASDDGGPPGGADGGAGQVCTAMDIVFVVDDSFSMEEEQSNLAANFPMFGQVLTSYEIDPGRFLDFHVAVTTTGVTKHYTIDNLGFPIPTTDNGDDGAFRQGCGVNRRWLERTDADLSGALACRADVGVDGPGNEMPFFATMLSLRERLADATNAGFLRDDALLAIVILTDEDDCSRSDDNFTIDAFDDPCAVPGAPMVMPDDMVAFLDDLKGGRGRWATAVIAAPTDCTSDFGDAVAAPKLQQFVQLANGGGHTNGVFSSICEGNLAPALTQALDTFTDACEDFPPID